MAQLIPKLVSRDLSPTRDYLRGVALALGSFQRGFLPPNEHDWQHGLEVGMRGFGTQRLSVQGEELRVNADLVRYKVRLGETNWKLSEYGGATIFKELKTWLKGKGIEAVLEEPDFSATTVSASFDKQQADLYAMALWWLDEQFRDLKKSLTAGLTSPILLYPHHFDLSLVWFPWDDERQLSVGWSTGDENIPEPYIYLTAYPEPKGFTKLALPAGAYWQSKGFSGAILPYELLRSNNEPAKLFQSFAEYLLAQGQELLS